MNPQNNVDSNTLGNKPNQKPAKVNPGSSGEKKPNLDRTRDDAANSEQNFGAGDELQTDQQNEKRKYDEADPYWTNEDPDAQAGRDEINPELNSNIGPQS